MMHQFLGCHLTQDIYRAGKNHLVEMLGCTINNQFHATIGPRPDVLDCNAGSHAAATAGYELQHATKHGPIPALDMAQRLLASRCISRCIEARYICPDKDSRYPLVTLTQFRKQQGFPHFFVRRPPRDADQPVFDRNLLQPAPVFDPGAIQDSECQSKFAP